MLHAGSCAVPACLLPSHDMGTQLTNMRHVGCRHGDGAGIPEQPGPDGARPARPRQRSRLHLHLLCFQLRRPPAARVCTILSQFNSRPQRSPAHNNVKTPVAWTPFTWHASPCCMGFEKKPGPGQAALKHNVMYVMFLVQLHGLCPVRTRLMQFL